MSSVAQRLLTAEEYWQSPLNSTFSELVRGQVIEMLPHGARAGEVAVTLGVLLDSWAKRATGGRVCARVGCILGREPDTVRGPHLSYLREGRVPTNSLPEGSWSGMPDLAVEIISPHSRIDEVHAKVRDFLGAGTPLVWVVYPRTQEVVVHTADGLARTYGENDVLEFPDVLPEFSCSVADLFV